MDNEAEVRIKINELLKQAGWRFEDNSKGKKNIRLEFQHQRKPADYVLFDNQGLPLVVVEAKRASLNPLDGKEQARRYAQKLNARFVILSNGELHYLWDIKFGNPLMINEFPTLMYLTYQTAFNPNYKELMIEKVDEKYIAFTQLNKFDLDPSYQDLNTRQAFVLEKKLKLLRPYQIRAIQALQQQAKDRKNRFLFEMATGTGKTLTTAAVIKLFLKTQNVKRVLFLVDRIELENQAKTSFDAQLKNDYQAVIYKENKRDWKNADIVITTVQSLIKNNRYETDFKPTDFDLIISDEAHRSINGIARNVFEYFIGFKLGLTATPKDYLKNFSADPNNPLEIERRSLLDTYQTFGCDQGEPTFRYALLDGVKDGYLVNPLVIDARTEVTTRLLSEKGYAFQHITDSEETDELFTGRDFEKTFFSEATNRIFCEAFLANALKDPISGETGKTIIFCVSQNHASKIVEILNDLIFKKFPNQYQSNFAMQVTSRIPNAQNMAGLFANNSLEGHSQFLEGYNTSKTRVCVTVGMMTTGYDCEDILNICFMRPIFSPTDFIQMKGRGTRPYLFESTDKKIQIKKQYFKLFDFFANYEYFETKFDYDQILQLPLIKGDVSSNKEPNDNSDKLTLTLEDHLEEIKETNIGLEGMKIDRQLFQKAKQLIVDDLEIKTAVELQQWEKAFKIIEEKYENKPDLYLTLDKLKLSENVDRRITWREVLDRVFGLIDHFMSKEELFDLDMEKLSKKYQPTPEQMSLIRHYIWTFLNDKYFKEIVSSKKIGKLSTYSGFTVDEFKKLGEYTTILPSYIAEKIDLNSYME